MQNLIANLMMVVGSKKGRGGLFWAALEDRVWHELFSKQGSVLHRIFYTQLIIL